MWNNVIGEHVRRTTRNLLLVNALLLAGLALLAWGNGRYLYNALLGPFEVDHRTLAATANPGAATRYFVTVTGDERFETGFHAITRTVDKYSRAVKSEQTTADYCVLRVGERLLLAKAPLGAEGVRLSGALGPIAAGLDEQLLGELRARRPDVYRRFLPFMLDATGFRSEAYWALALGTPLLLLALWNVRRGRARRSDPSSHPAVAGLKRFGTPQEIAARIQAETAAGAERAGDLVLTPSWLLRGTFFGLTVVRLEDVVWVYRKVTKHSVNFIPTGKSHALVVQQREGAPLEIPGKEQAVVGWIEGIVRRVPWALAGYDQQLETAWKANRATVIQAVDQRRRAT